MINFSEFVKQPKKIQLDIQRGSPEELSEGVHVPYFGFMGKEVPEGEHLGNGVFQTGEDSFIHHNGTKVVRFKSQDAADEYARVHKKKYVANLKQAHDDVAKHFNYSEDEAKSLTNYTNHLKGLNHKLIVGAKLEPHEERAVGALDSTLSRYSAPDDLTVYSGTNSEHANIIRRNEVVQHPVYLSTSISNHGAKQFAASKGGDIVKIEVPKGHPGAYVAAISGYEGEREFVLPRGTKLKFHPEKAEKMVSDSGEHIVHYATIEGEHQQ